MYPNILTDQQIELLPFINKFKKNYYLAGGTAIALHIGHRKSIDFELFTNLPLNKRKISDEIRKMPAPPQPIFFDADQQHYIINGVKCTFLYFPYKIGNPELFEEMIYMPSLLDLSAMKAFALGRRSK